MTVISRKKVLVLGNIVSGVGAFARYLPRIIETLAVNGCEATVYPIIPSRGLTSGNILKECTGDFDVLLVCGGDGTLNYVVNDMQAMGIQKPVCYIPCGTTNDFGRSIEENMSADQICRCAAMGKIKELDIANFNGRYFNYVAAFGAFTKSSYSTPQNVKNVLGYSAYVLNSIGTFPDSIGYRKHVKLTHDGITEEGNYMYGGISNSLTIGGIRFPFADNPALDDGLLEVVLVRSPDNPADFAAIIGNLATGYVDQNMIRCFQAKQITVECDDPLEWTIDGEEGGRYRKAEIAVCPKALQILV